MGYYTRFQLRYEIDKDSPSWREFENRLWEYFESNEDSNNDDIDWYGVWNSLRQDEPTKWYSHKDDMIKISKMFPMILFNLYGSGEEQGDVWMEYYRDGKYCRLVPYVSWPEFNERMLK